MTIKDQEYLEDQKYQISFFESAFIIGKVDGLTGERPTFTIDGKQAYLRGYALGVIERFNIPKEYRDFREEPHEYPSCNIAFATDDTNTDENQAFNRGYVFGVLDRFKIPEKDRDFRSEF